MKKTSSAFDSRTSAARALVKWVAAREQVPVASLRGASRVRSLSRVRAICGYLGRDVAGVPIARVALEVDRDPSTLWRDVQWLEGEMKRDRAVAKSVREIAAACAAWVKGSAAAPRR